MEGAAPASPPAEDAPPQAAAWVTNQKAMSHFWGVANDAAQMLGLKPSEARAWVHEALQVDSAKDIGTPLDQAVQDVQAAAARQARARVVAAYQEAAGLGADATLTKEDGERLRAILVKKWSGDLMTILRNGVRLDEVAAHVRAALLMETLSSEPPAPNPSPHTAPAPVTAAAPLVEVTPDAQGSVEYRGKRYRVALRPGATPEMVSALLATWERVWAAGEATYTHASLAASPTPAAESSVAGEERSLCSMIAVVAAYGGGGDQLEFHVEGRQSPLRYTRPKAEMLALLRGVTRANGAPFTEADLSVGKRHGGAWIVVHGPAKDPRYRNVKRVEADNA
jgi:hypothetical protein